MASFFKRFLINPIVDFWNWLFHRNRGVEYPSVNTVFPEETTRQWSTMGWTFIPGREKIENNRSVLRTIDPEAVEHLTTAIPYLKECGVTMLLSRIPHLTYSGMMTILDTCLENGVKFVAWGYELSRIHNIEKSAFKRNGLSEKEAAVEAGKKVEELIAHEAFHAIYLYDEPTFSLDDPMSSYFEIARDHKKFNYLARKYGKKMYVNLFPICATDKQLGIGTTPFARGTFQSLSGDKDEFSDSGKVLETYSDYINTFLPYTDILSSDFYPVRMHDNENYLVVHPKLWYKHLATMLEKHKEHPEKEFRLYLQTARFGEEYPVLTENSLRLQSYANMMIGVQGLQYWSMMDVSEQKTGSVEINQTHFDTPFSLDGTPNETTFNIVSDLNNSEKFQTYTKILPNISIDSLYYFDKSDLYAYDTEFDELYEEINEPRLAQYVKSLNNPCLVSFAENKCMILNLSMINKMTVKLQPDLYVIEGKTSTPTNNHGGKYTIQPGDLIIVSKL